jgi:hypothetical protein
MSWLGFRSHSLIKPLKILLNVQTLNKPLTPSLLILAVRHWRFIFSICLSIKFTLSFSPALEWDGLEGSLAKFGCSVGLVRFAKGPVYDHSAQFWQYLVREGNN